MTDKPPLLWHSNAPWASTGYGQQTALFCPQLDDEYRVGISAFYGLEAGRAAYKGMTVYPTAGQSVGNDTLPLHAKSHFGGDKRAGTVATLMDVWVLDPGVASKLNMVCWTPVDHDPVQEKVVSFFEHSGAVPLAMSRFGQKQLERFDALYCPHAVDTDVFRPLEQREAREVTRIPQDTFVVGMVAANKGFPPRKCFLEALQAFKQFNARHPDSVLYMHTDVTGIADGLNLEPLVKALGLQKQTLFTNQERYYLNPYPDGVMAAVYSSLDVLLLASAGEGFGLPVLEAHACGVPAIVSDFSAQPEVCGAGWHVQTEPVWTPASSWQCRPSVPDMVEALNHAYSLSGTARDTLKAKARAHAEQYEIGRVVRDHMLPALQEARERLAGRAPVEVAAR